MMDFEEFKEQVITEIKDYLPAEYENATVELHEVYKNNDVKLDSLTIHREDSNISPNIYLNSFFEDYQNGRQMEDILDTIAKLNVEHSQVKHFDVSQIMDFEQIKVKIVPRLVNAENNVERLTGKPFTEMEDLAIMYSVELSRNEEGVTSITVSNEMLREWGITESELHNLAMENFIESGNPVLTDMRTVMVEMMAKDMMQMGMNLEDAKEYVATMMPEDAAPMYVVTNDMKVNGANVILNQKFMDGVADKLGGDFFVLPSSVHECICIPKDEGMSYHEFESMVQDVNATKVAPEERLSGHVYEYDAKAHELMRSDKAEERKAERAQAGREEKGNERVSVKAKLTEKKQEIAKQTKDLTPSNNRKQSIALA